MDDDCFICRKHPGQIEIPGGLHFEDEQVVVSRPANIDYPTYLMLGTRRHVWEPADLTTIESEAVGHATLSPIPEWASGQDAVDFSRWPPNL